MKNILLLSLLFFIKICLAQTELNNYSKNMEKFNIQLFKSLAKDDEYTNVLMDGSIIEQMEISDGFVEKTVFPKEWFYLYKEFYLNGEIRIQGKSFICGDYKAGVWLVYNENGKVINQTDYDSEYKLSLDSVLKILEENKVVFSKENKSNKITRNIADNKATWFVQYKLTLDRVEVLNIDDVTGKIIKRSFIKFRSRN